MFIFLLLCFVKLTISCPDKIKSFCVCEEIVNGINLDCSNSSWFDTLNFIRSQQAHIGLIQSLTLNNAGLKELSSGLFSGTYIKKLDLSFNAIASIDNKAFAGMNPVLEELSLKSNLIKKIPMQAFLELPNLQQLDLSNNSISNILPDEVFPYLKKFYAIDLNNNSISSVHANFFENVRNSLQIINFGHNKLKTVPSSAIRGLKQLKSLHLHHNHIVQIDALSFLNLPVLALLNLAENSIREFNRQAFLNVPNLRYLYLSGNQISKLYKHQFQSFDNIEMIDLTRNQIAEIPEYCFSGLKYLRQIFLGKNLLREINSNSFINSSIVVMVLSENNITQITNESLSAMKTLQQLSLRGNKIKLIETNAFRDVSSLVMLDLANNNLQELAPSTFLSQLDLLFVDLSENKLQKVPYTAFNKRVGTIILKKNPLVCSEKIHILQDGNGIFLKENKDYACDDDPSSENSIGETKTKAIPKLQIRKNPLNVQNEKQQPDLENIAITNENTPSEATSGNSFLLRKNHLSTDSVSHHTDVLPTRQKNTELETLSTNVNEKKNSINISNRIFPLPIPFLKRGPSLSKSFLVENTTSAHEIAFTLPPKNYEKVIKNVILKIFISFRNEDKTTTIESSTENTLNLNTVSLETEQKEQVLDGNVTKNYYFSTVIMTTCVVFALVVLMIVIVGLCISKHRNLQSHSETSAKHYETQNAYPTNCFSHVRTATEHFNESPSWIYNPGSGYCNYYK